MKLAAELTQLFINNQRPSIYTFNSTNISPLITLCRISVYNPADGSLVSDQIPISGEADVEQAIQAAQEAFAPGSKWRRMDDFTRQKILLKFADLIERDQECLASLTRVTLGAPYKLFGKSEIDTAIGCFRCELVPEFMGAR
ncbi:Aldedh-domain-containing protein [Aspergillus sclerotiicarbonarius CBS 121057]|uniref:aldehyde dehydrogenase (NAD(+)) n=1 Tax=Aspergillus sclerotiicarbonarius (strain CBS 121057 / IBT 28362) TaxID=1448318 RepID=A0A319EGN0_ASPSB|nr:Aldedh-domain-containing protein [Aspergillus sclerotiicarbonarius CBS 121057]